MVAVLFGQFLQPPQWRGVVGGRPREGESREPPLIAGRVDKRRFQIHMGGHHRGPQIGNAGEISFQNKSSGQAHAAK